MPAKIGGENQIVKSQEICTCIKNERPELLKILQNDSLIKGMWWTRNDNHYVLKPIFLKR